MKANRGTSLAATKITFSPPAFHWTNRHRGALAALVLLLGALQVQLFVSTALAESSKVGKSGGAHPLSVHVDSRTPATSGHEPSFGTAIYENLCH
jgi:hypothetical protein